MECNREEATRAKEIAEKKFTAMDIAGAKKFALKAQNMYPSLEGLSQMLVTLDVYLSAKNKVGGEADWYGVLGVTPSDDDDTIRKQYRKLALMVHPDKNKSVGAEGAFKLVSEAWTLLSDKSKRVAYDQKIPKTCQQKVPTTSRGPCVPDASSKMKAAHKFTTHSGRPTSAPVPDTSSNMKAAHKFTTNSGPTAAPASSQQVHSSTDAKGFTNSSRTSSVGVHKGGIDTGPKTAPVPPCPTKSTMFWTSCEHCKVRYEYLRVYQNHTLLCPNCRVPFLAVEMPTPPSLFWISCNRCNIQYEYLREYQNHSVTCPNCHEPFLAVESPSPPSMFWTSCSHCKRQYEYLRVYENHTLFCSNCRELFLAVETPIPPSNGSDSSATQQRQNSKHPPTNKKTRAPGKKTAPKIRPVVTRTRTRTCNVGHATATAHSANVAHQTYEKATRT